MITLYKYIIISIIKSFFLVQSVVLSIYLVVDFAEKVRSFIEAEIPVKLVITFFFYKIPFIFYQTATIGLLISIVLVFGIMKKNNELIALKSCGIGFDVFLKVTVGIGIVGSLILIIVSELIVPSFAIELNKIWLNGVSKKKIMTSECNDIWFKTAKEIVHIKNYFPKENKALDFTINYFDEAFVLIRRVDAKIGIIYDNKCLLYGVLEQKMDKEISKHDIISHDMLNIDVNFTSEDLEKNARKFDDMSLNGLYKYAKKIEFEGCDATRYWVDFHSRISFFFVCIIFSILGICIVFIGGLSRSILLNITHGICLVFMYWVLNSLCISFGYGGVVLPIVSAWVANLIFFCGCVVVLLSIE